MFFVSTPSFHDIIIPIFTSLLLILVYIHFRGFICSMNITERIILVRARPILLPNIIKKPPPQIRTKNPFILFFISYFITPIPQDVNGLPNQSLSIKKSFVIQDSTQMSLKCFHITQYLMKHYFWHLWVLKYTCVLGWDLWHLH